MLIMTVTFVGELCETDYWSTSMEVYGGAMFWDAFGFGVPP